MSSGTQWCSLFNLLNLVLWECMGYVGPPAIFGSWLLLSLSWLGSSFCLADCKTQPKQHIASADTTKQDKTRPNQKQHVKITNYHHQQQQKNNNHIGRIKKKKCTERQETKTIRDTHKKRCKKKRIRKNKN